MCICFFQGQVQSGLRSGIRLAQGSYIRITVTKPIPVQVDGEPWIQSPGQIIISAAGPKVQVSDNFKRYTRISTDVLYIKILICFLLAVVHGFLIDTEMVVVT